MFESNREIILIGGYVVEDPRHGYYSTATLPSSASLRKTSGYQIIQGPPGVRAISEPRAAKKLVAAANTNTLDRYTLMAAQVKNLWLY